MFEAFVIFTLGYVAGRWSGLRSWQRWRAARVSGAELQAVLRRAQSAEFRRVGDDPKGVKYER